MVTTSTVRNGPVFPLPLSFRETGKVDNIRTGQYVKYLQKHGAKTLMTTAGTTQFNLLTPTEIIAINDELASRSSVDNLILGLPAGDLGTTLIRIMRMNDTIPFSSKHVGLMLLYPERYYGDDETIISYFYRCADASKLPIYIHGLPMRDARSGGVHDFDAPLLTRIAAHPNIVGMKEESSSYEKAYNIINELTRDAHNFVVIVAGGDQRRFLLTRPVGAHTFLTGVGNIIPEIDICFFDAIQKGDDFLVTKYLNLYHNPVYDLFSKIGWHKALREALRQKGFIQYDRQPFPKCSTGESELIRNVLRKLE